MCAAGVGPRSVTRRRRLSGYASSMRTILTVGLLWAGSSFAQCTRDTDCKGNRVCEAGACIESDTPIAAAPMVSAPGVSISPMAAARLVELNAELRDLRERLDDATLAGPIVKLALAGVAAAGGVVFFSLAQSAATEDLYRNSLTFSYIFTGVAVALVIWGSIQLGLRLHARRSLPPRIADAEEQIKALSR